MKAILLKKDIDKRKIIRDYKQLSERLGRPATQKDFNKYMPYSSTVVTSRFGSFVKLREEAGFPIDKEEQVEGFTIKKLF